MNVVRHERTVLVREALDAVPGLAPAVRSAVGDLDWSAVGDAAVIHFVDVLLPDVTQRLRRLGEELDGFRVAAMQWAAPGALEARLPGAAEEGLAARLDNSAADVAGDRCFAAYCSVCLLVMVDADAIRKPDEIDLDDWQLVRATRQAQFDLGLGAAATALAGYARLLGWESTPDPAQLASSIQSRIGSRGDPVVTDWLATLVRVLNANGQWRGALAAMAGFFRSAGEAGPTERWRAGFAARVAWLQTFENRLQEAYSPDVADAHLDLIVGDWNTMIRGALTAIGQLIEAQGPDAGELVRQRFELLDGVAGWQGSVVFDPLPVAFLLRHSPVESLLGVLSPWVNSLADRQLLGPLTACVASAFEDLRTADDETATAFWGAPGALGLLGVTVALLNQLDLGSHREAGADFVDECLGDAAPVLGSLAQVAVAPDDPRRRRLAEPLLMRATLRLFLEGRYQLVVSTLEQTLRVAEWEEHGGAALRSRCEAGFHEAATLVSQFSYSLWAAALVAEGNVFAAFVILEGIFGGIPPDPLFDLERVRLATAEAPGGFQMALSSLQVLMHVLGRGPALRRVLEGECGLPDICEAATPELSAALERYLSSARSAHPKSIKVDQIVTLAEAAAQTHGPGAARRFWECVLGTEGLPDSTIQTVFHEADSDAWALATLHLADPLLSQHLPERWLAIVEVLCERDADGGSQWLEFGHRFDNLALLGEWVQKDTRRALQSKILAALRTGERQEAACELARRLARSPSWLDRPRGSRAGEGAMLLAFEVARLLDHEDVRLLRRLHRKLEPMVGDIYGYRRTFAADRHWAAVRSAEARRTLIEMGHTLAHEEGPESDRQRTRNLVIETHLAQQSLLMRYLRGRPVPEVLGTEGFASGPFPEPAKRRRSRTQGPRMLLDQRASEGATAELLSVPHQPDDGPPSWKEGLTARDVARALGSGCALLRAGFSLDGHLVWTLFRSDGADLAVVAHDRGRGQRTDRAAVEAALAHFELRLESAWDLEEVCLAPGGSGCWQRLLDVIEQGRRGLDSGIFDRLYDPLRRFPRLLKRFLAEVGPLDDTNQCSRAQWDGWWRAAVARFDPSSDLRHALDSATAELCARIETVVDVDAIAQGLDATDELLVWVDDALLGVPFGFLQGVAQEGRRKYVFECVDAMRTIVSPLLDDWMRAQDGAAVDRTGQPVIASLSWFEDRLAGEQATEELLRDVFFRLNRIHRGTFDWQAAGSWVGVPGCHDVLAQGVAQAADRPIALLAVCGHGHLEPHGVHLGDGVWDGSRVWRLEDEDRRWRARGACDLSQIDFLIQLSCSIGRLKQSGFQDVEGFCAELFLNRARSVVAGRWPLHAAESVQYASWIAQAYLRRYARAASGDSAQRRSRGRAVAAARRHWLARSRKGGSPVGLNTVAGLDLYGLS